MRESEERIGFLEWGASESSVKEEKNKVKNA
jgi:hypothetical protein